MTGIQTARRAVLDAIAVMRRASGQVDPPCGCGNCGEVFKESELVRVVKAPGRVVNCRNDDAAEPEIEVACPHCGSADVTFATPGPANGRTST